MGSMEAWAAADPAGRDALLELAEQAVALQPAAEVVIQCAHRDQDRRDPGWAGEQERVEGAYRVLLAQLHAREEREGGDQVAGEPLGALLEQHGALVASARTAPPDGLGQVAGELVAFRDRLRRTAPVQGRVVADLRADKLL